MEKFKPLKELVKALTYIGDAIKGEESEEDSIIKDDSNYVIIIGRGNFGFVNKNLDSTKVAFNIENVSFTPTILGDIFTQEGVDIINSMLSHNLIKTNTIKVFVFLKDTPEGNLLYSPVSLRFKDDTNEYIIEYGERNITGSTSDKFTLDTPMKNNSIQ